MKGAIALRIYLATTSRVVRKEQTKIMGDSLIVLQKGDHCAICLENQMILLSNFFFLGGGHLSTISGKIHLKCKRQRQASDEEWTLSKRIFTVNSPQINAVTD